MNELGIDVIRVNGNEALAKCPAHLERTGKADHHPSFSVNIEEGVGNCFSCGFRGPFVIIAAYVLGISRDDAVGWVRARGGIERARRSLAAAHSTPALVNTAQQMNEATLALFTEPPVEALEARGLSLASARHYGVLWDAEKDCWITPIRDPDTGRLWGYQAKNERWFRNRPMDVKKSKTLFGLAQSEFFDSRGRIILVESPLDCLRLFTAGVEGGVSSYGAGVSETQMALILIYAEELIVGLDNDKDGNTYSKWILDNYRGRGLNIKFLNYADFNVKDPGDMTDEQIHYSIDTAISSQAIRFS